MNYTVIFCGYLNPTFDIVTRLMVESARESDYLVTTLAHPVLSPCSTIAVEAKMLGSAKNIDIPVVLDFDHVYTGHTPIHLTPKKLDIEVTGDFNHYWGVAGALLKVITDLSPAYVTSYLLEKGMNSELSAFKKQTLVSLPFDIQEYIATTSL